MRLRATAAALVVGLVVTACGGASDGKTSGQGGAESAGKPDPNATVTIAAGEDTWPAQGAGAESTTFAYPLNVNVYEPLIYLGSDYTLKPGLATSWELIAPTTWRFHLRRGVTFQDGKPFTADDVIWTWGVRQQKGQTLSTVTDTLGPDSVKKVDDFTVDFVPKTPNLRLPEQIVHPEGAIVEKGKDFDSQPPVGTGPFKVVSYQPSQQVTLARYDGYWGTKAGVKQMTYRFLPDPQTRIEALKANTVDFVLDLPPDAVSTLTTDDRFHVVRSSPGRNQLIYVNKLGKAPFDLAADPAVRQAISLALDRKGYVDTVFEGNAEPGRLMAPAAILGQYADDVAAIPFDAKKAASVLAADGWTAGPDGVRAKNGRKLSLTMIAWAEVTDQAMQLIQAELKDVGIALTVKKAADQPTYSSYYKSGNFDLDLEVPNQNDGNPAFLPVLRMYSKNKNTQRFAPGGEFDVQAQQALAAKTDDGARKASAAMMKILINDTYIVVPVAAEVRIYGMTKNVNLGDPHPSQTNQLWTSVTKTG